MFILIGVVALFMHAKACPSTCQCNDTTYQCRLNGQVGVETVLSAVAAISSHPRTLHIDMCKPVRKLRRLPSLNITSLTISRCWIDSIEPGAFNSLKDTLKALYLYRNNITNFNWGLHQLENLRVLSLQHNQIRMIPRLTFYYNPHLAVLLLSSNEISHISSEAFDKANSQLSYLDLDYNRLQHFPARFLSRKSEKDFSRLLYFSVSANNITFIPRNAIGNYSHLALIDVSHNKISSIHSAAFNCPQLKMIDASGNHLVSFTTAVPPAVEILRLGGNRLEAFDFTTLAPLTRLRVDLSHNKLTIPGPILDELCPSSLFFTFEGNAETASPEAMHCNRLWNESHKSELFITNNRLDITCVKPLEGCDSESMSLRLRYS